MYTGLIFSLVLICIIFSQINWSLFFSTIFQIQPLFLLLAASFIVIGVATRSLRWNLLTEFGLNDYRSFWDAVNLGYLGNLIYPARAGEIIRIVALKKSIPIPEGIAISTAVVDRLSDCIMLPLFIFLVLEYFSKTIEIPVSIKYFSLIFVVISLLLGLYIIWGKKIEVIFIMFFPYQPDSRLIRISQFISQLHTGASTLKNSRCLLSVFLLSVIVFLLDSSVFYFLFLSFGWDLPFSAAILVCIFIFAGSALPSTPGYFGIYQVACILALRPFGIPDSASVAYSLIMQGITYTIFLIVGGWIIYSRHLSLQFMKS